MRFRRNVGHGLRTLPLASELMLDSGPDRREVSVVFGHLIDTNSPSRCANQIWEHPMAAGLHTAHLDVEACLVLVDHQRAWVHCRLKFLTLQELLILLKVYYMMPGNLHVVCDSLKESAQVVSGSDSIKITHASSAVSCLLQVVVFRLLTCHLLKDDMAVHRLKAQVFLLELL